MDHNTACTILTLYVCPSTGLYVKLESAGRAPRHSAAGKRERSDSQLEQAALLANISKSDKTNGAAASTTATVSAIPAAAIVSEVGAVSSKAERAGCITPMLSELIATDLVKHSSMDPLTDSCGASAEALSAAVAAVAGKGGKNGGAVESVDASADPFQTSLPFKKRRKTGDGSVSGSTQDLPSVPAAVVAAAERARPLAAAAGTSTSTTTTTAAGSTKAKGVNRDTDSEGTASSLNGDAVVDQLVLDSLAQSSSDGV